MEAGMDKVYITNLMIENVRHLKDIQIPLSKEKPKHLILTGKNGSGKTSVLEAVSYYLHGVSSSDELHDAQKKLKFWEEKLYTLQQKGDKSSEIIEAERAFNYYKGKVDKYIRGISIRFNESLDTIRYHFEKGELVLAYYKANRVFEADVSKHVEKIDLQEKYLINDEPRKVFIKYLVDLKVTEALARNNGKAGKADEIKRWFDKFQELLGKIFEDDSLELIFDEENFSFVIKQKNREAFDFNTLSSGFAAVLDIVLDLIVRMERKSNRSFDFAMPGIVLIDEIETHLHLDLQKTILSMLTTLFPNIQFIVSTHSPFILNSLENVVIYDLENEITVENGLVDVPYSGIVEGYFKASEMSAVLQKKFERYKKLVRKDFLTDEDFAEIARLELFLEEIPDYLALNITTEYQRLKLELENREDI